MDSKGTARRWALLGARAAAIALVGALALSGTPGLAFAEDEAAIEEGQPTAAMQTDGDTASAETRALIESADELADGVNIMKTGASNQTFNIGDGQALMIANQESDTPIVFENCTFNLSGETVLISNRTFNTEGVVYNNGETITKLWIGGSVEFRNCKFVTAPGASRSSTNGYDAAIYFYSGDIDLYNCTLSAEGYNGQFLGLYAGEVLGYKDQATDKFIVTGAKPNGAVTFDHCNISTVGNKNGWSYAMYAGSVLNLVNGSTMTATGSTTDGGNINCFYSGDAGIKYNAINIKDSTIDFSDNQAGGFAINNVNIHVNNSTITVNDNLGNACNSGYWIVDNSTIQMDGNRGGHGLSCIGFEMANSRFEVLHNGYAGVYIQSIDSSFDNCSVDLRCNGELRDKNGWSYSAGDLWLQGHTLTVNGTTTSDACEGSIWLGGVGRTGSVVTNGDSSVVAFDLVNLPGIKGNTSDVLSNANVALNGEQDGHVLFLNPYRPEALYARGSNETSAYYDNDCDLFEDERIGTTYTDSETGETLTYTTDTVTGGDTARIDYLTDAQLSHHKYDWDNPEFVSPADENNYGVTRYTCNDVCADYLDRTDNHPYGIDCDTTYVYAPLVGLEFDANLPEGVAADDVTMPENQTAIEYDSTATEPEDPSITDDSADYGWVFTGWYTDADCTEPFDFSTQLTKNWTKVYAGWVRVGATQTSVGAEKDLTGATLKANEFGFSLTALDGAPMPANALGTTKIALNDARGAIDFGEISFDAAGTYRYEIREITPAEDDDPDTAGIQDGDWTYDDSVHELVVTVEYVPGEDSFQVTSVLYDGAAAEPVFENSYTGTTPSEPICPTPGETKPEPGDTSDPSDDEEPDTTPEQPTTDDTKPKPDDTTTPSDDVTPDTTPEQPATGETTTPSDESAPEASTEGACQERAAFNG